MQYFSGYKPHRCELCEKEFMTAYILKKHLESHYNERRFKCGECGKLYKSIAHVKEHMRAHSDDRPYLCPVCGKKYKTKVREGAMAAQAWQFFFYQF